jgi:hypothetical protein
MPNGLLLHREKTSIGILPLFREDFHCALDALSRSRGNLPARGRVRSETIPMNGVKAMDFTISVFVSWGCQVGGAWRRGKLRRIETDLTSSHNSNLKYSRRTVRRDDPNAEINQTG